MAEDFDLVPYKDISDLKKEFESMKSKKDISATEFYESVQKLAQTITNMLEVFGAAAEQMKLEEKEYETEAKKHEAIISKLDKLIDQNKTIAEGMVAIVEMVKEKIASPSKEEEPDKPREEILPKPRPEPRTFRPVQQQWQPRPEPIMPRQQQMMSAQIAQAQMGLPPLPPMQAPPSQTPFPSPMPTPSMPSSPPDFGIEMPPMEPAPMPDLDFPEEPLLSEEEPKKKGLFGMFKK